MKKTTERGLLQSCLARIQKDLGVKVVSLKRKPAQNGALIEPADAVVQFKFGQESAVTYWVEIKPHFQKIHLPYLLSLYASYFERNRNARVPQLLVLSEYINPELGHLLKDSGIQFADACGNMYLKIGNEIVYFILAHRPAVSSFKKSTIGSAFHFAGTKVLYAILVNPNKKSTVRELAVHANVGFATSAMALRDLIAQGLISISKDKIAIHSPKMLIEKWLLSYSTYLRPKISLGFYRFAEKNAHELLSKLTKSVQASKLGIAVTGDLAAEHYTKYLLGGKPCIFLEKGYLNLSRKDPALMPTNLSEGIEILDYFCPTIISDDLVSGKQSSHGMILYAHPLLVYAELMHSGTERQVEAATILYEKYIRKILER